MKAGGLKMKAGERWLRQLLQRQGADDLDADTVLLNFMTDLAIFVGEALLSAICLKIAAVDGNVTFLMLGILAAVAAALPLRDWIRG
jgi:hypothetical protein